MPEWNTQTTLLNYNTEYIALPVLLLYMDRIIIVQSFYNTLILCLCDIISTYNRYVLNCTIYHNGL
jgi:hypothetical protein